MEWRIAYAHRQGMEANVLRTIAEIEASGYDIIPAQVPGCLELDLMKAGKLKDLYYSVNTLEAQKLEDVDVWYFTRIRVESPAQYLHFEGIDTVADIYVNGQPAAGTDNMFLAYDVEADWIIGENEVVVHISPAMLEARKYVTPAGCNAQKYSYPALHLRKAAHMFGWDIMPRIVSAGIWKDVSLRQKRRDVISEVYLTANEVDLKAGTAKMRFYMHGDLSGNIVQDYSVRVEGHCGDSSFYAEDKLWHTVHTMNFTVENAQFWWPKNYGKPNLYDTTVTLLKDGKVCDQYSLKIGIRTIELSRTDVTDQEGNGDFCFLVNGRRIFALGTNWVPLDAFHSNDSHRLKDALGLVDDIGCNMVRCWGGNVYESDEFFNFCDAHGIMVWQDFAMGCAVYPWDRDFCSQMEREAAAQIKRLRNHPALVLWAGDNENDLAYSWSGYRRDPNANLLTREVLPRAVEMHDYTRPYLASSPYLSEKAYQEKAVLPENHLWGPRDYFKGDFYKNTFTHFASEIGYHGFPSPASLKRFLKNPEKIFEENGIVTEEYLVHAAAMETADGAPYTYRIKLACDQVVTLFGKAEENWMDFLCQSQISQAEAKKYFIEKFRIGKGKRTGIIWWNLVDGWPQVSDAVVDYYYVKKLAYHYIKRSQQPVCMMFDEPAEGRMALVAVNDLPKAVKLNYTVKRILSQGKEEEVLSGKLVLGEDTTVTVDSLPVSPAAKDFYLIQWEMDGQEYRNHYFTNILDISYRDYMAALKHCSMDEFEGF